MYSSSLNLLMTARQFLLYQEGGGYSDIAVHARQSQKMSIILLKIPDPFSEQQEQ
jgi:hypothetical protein